MSALHYAVILLHSVFPFLILRQKRPPNMWCAVNEIILNYKVTERLQNSTSEQSTTSKARGRHHTDMSGADGGSGLRGKHSSPFQMVSLLPESILDLIMSLLFMSFKDAGSGLRDYAWASKE